ncbi:hypothetical protein [Rhodobaculum claviforme]|uniref:Uncharacterized protein n=1 Tax=Rhodobaculum claviforme TaxID=1549854 RepID=A0A934TL14_9RHOB|nr:hypothetical protein [Rhodobaculum claviforme]MBK5928069.1 hypothetical protein [Rhodobaculum claviforme]
MSADLSFWILGPAVGVWLLQMGHLLWLNRHFHNGSIVPWFRNADLVSLTRRKVVQRAEHYAVLLSDDPALRVDGTERDPQGATTQCCAPPLSGPGHAILLGILKKIEAKNATLATLGAIVVAFLGLFLTGPVGDSLVVAAGNSSVGYLTLAFGAILVLPGGQLFVGIRQLDQKDFGAMADDPGRAMATRARMQWDLIDDLLRKERAFAFAEVWIGVVLLLLLIGLPLVALIWGQ